MSKNRVIIIICILFLLLIACGKEGFGTLEGKITITTLSGKKSVADVNIVVTGDRLKNAINAKSNENGLYKIDNLPAGNYYSVIFEKAGVEKIIKENIHIQKDRPTTLHINIPGLWRKARTNWPTVA